MSRRIFYTEGFSMIRVGIVGASGYGGGELLRLLAGHPDCEIAAATSATYAGKAVQEAFPGLANRLSLRFLSDAGSAELAACDVVFLARDNGVAMKEAPALLAAGCKVIDLSADFRFRNIATYERWYIQHASPELAAEAVYGLPELHRDAIRGARLVGNPGCYTTASILALAPLVEKGTELVDPGSIVIDAKSGVSGAGRSRFGLGTHFSEVNESVSAYKIAGAHRHTPEIEEQLSLLAGRDLTVSFTPHLIPMTRGILATCYVTLTRDMTGDEIRALYRERYAGEPFVYVSDGLPATKHTLGTNMLHIGLDVDPRNRRVTIVSCLDNLGKGMAGQAIQNMNLLFGLDETRGLAGGGLWP